MEMKMSVPCGYRDKPDMPYYPGGTACNVPQNKCSLAMAYVPWQKWDPPYDDEKGFMTGTIFPSLDLPFCAGGMQQ